MKTTEEKIAVMQAYADGKEIECSANNWFSRWTEEEPHWNWDAYDYRVKPVPLSTKIFPYASAEEFFQAQKEHGIYIRERNGLIYIPSVIGNTCITVGGGGDYSYYILSTRFHFLDGTPCGRVWEM